MEKAITTNNIPSRIKASIARFAELKRQGVANLYEACKEYARCTQGDLVALRAYEEAFPVISKTTWDRMRLVGNNALDSEALLLTDSGVSRVMACGDLKAQRQLMAAAIDVVCEETGKVVKKTIKEMTPVEVSKAVTSAGKIVPIEKQTAPRQVTMRAAYVINGQVLHVNRMCDISLNELVNIVKTMKAGG